MKSRRVLCVGNALCNDDGVALAVAERLRALSANASVIEAGEFGLSCLPAFEGASQVVVVDAVKTGDKPGSCKVWTDPSFIPSSTCSIGHAVSLASMLELVAELEQGAIPRVSVVGIEAFNLNPFGTELSQPVQDAIPEAVRLVLAELELPLEFPADATSRPN
jgi:hydrogenase maturation protease